MICAAPSLFLRPDAPSVPRRAASAHRTTALVRGLTDPRIAAWQLAKLAALLLEPGNPTLLRVDLDGGHGVGATRSQVTSMWVRSMRSSSEPTCLFLRPRRCIELASTLYSTTKYLRCLLFNMRLSLFFQVNMRFSENSKPLNLTTLAVQVYFCVATKDRRCWRHPFGDRLANGKARKGVRI